VKPLRSEHCPVNYYRRYVGDLAKKTQGLDATELGTYDMMMDYCYAQERPLPLDLDEIHVICRCSKPEHFAAVTKVLARYWTAREDGYHQDRVDQELALAQPVIEAQRAAARETNRKRWGNRDDERDAERIGIATEDAEHVAERDGGAVGLPNRLAKQPSTTIHQHKIKSKTLQLAALAADEQPGCVVEDAVQKHNSGIVREAGFTVAVWNAYSGAYRERYNVEPVRNRTVNGQIAQLVSRLGIEAAPAVASFYVHHNFMHYVRAKHPVSLLLRDAEGLHTEWLSGRTVTSSEAMQTDRTAGMGNVWNDILATLPPEEKVVMAAKGADDESY
jgi:uncharacterized protein YdaU (DUF1376 family)